MTHGPIPDGLWVLHRCDNKPCVNPAHLFLGTQQDNTDDLVQKGLNAYGERSGTAKLTDADVLAMRAEYAAGGITQNALAEKYGLAFNAASSIIRGNSWKHLPLTPGGGPFNFLEHNGKRLTVAGWAKELGCSPNTLWQRLNRGWDTEKALTTPLQRRSRS